MSTRCSKYLHNSQLLQSSSRGTGEENFIHWICGRSWAPAKQAPHRRITSRCLSIKNWIEVALAVNVNLELPKSSAFTLLVFPGFYAVRLEVVRLSEKSWVMLRGGSEVSRGKRACEKGNKALFGDLVRTWHSSTWRNQNSLLRRSDGKITGHSLLKTGSQLLIPSCGLPLLAFLLPGTLVVLLLVGSSARVGEIYFLGVIFMRRVSSLIREVFSCHFWVPSPTACSALILL